MEEKSVMSELSEGMKLANELKRKIIDHPSTTTTTTTSTTTTTNSSGEECGLLVEKIVSCYDNALALLNCIDLLTNNVTTTTQVLSHHDSKDYYNHVSNYATKKRKSSSSSGLSEQVKVSSDAGFGGQVDDGYYWRKYGQKDILGANHPRSYYRCTHRYTQGCAARKQVQQVEESPCSVFEVVYKGNHTCTQDAQLKHYKKHDDHHVIKEQAINDRFADVSTGVRDSSPFSSPDSNLSIMNLATGDLDVLIDQVNFYYHSLEAAGFF